MRMSRAAVVAGVEANRKLIYWTFSVVPPSKVPGGQIGRFIWADDPWSDTLVVLRTSDATFWYVISLLLASKAGPMTAYI